MQRKIHVLLADDHPLVRVGIRTTLEEANGIKVVGEAKCGAEVLPLCIELVPDVLLLDLSMPNMEPVTTVTAVRAKLPQIKVIILSAHNTSAYVRSMIEADVNGYVLKDDAPEDIVQAIQAVMCSRVWYSQAVVQKMIALKWTDSSQGYTKLSSREQEILRLIVSGQNNIQIARELQLAEQTVRNYISNIYQTLKVAGRVEAVVWAIQHGIQPNHTKQSNVQDG